jgi:hypothetical protein
LITILATRLALLPLNIYQIKQGYQFGFMSSLVQEINSLAKKSTLSGPKRFGLMFRLARKLSQKENASPLKLFLSAIAPYPFLVFVLFAVRKAAMAPGIRETSLLWIPNLYTPDPYFILPLLASGITYINFGIGINQLTMNTFIGRFRVFMQKVTLIWFISMTQFPGSMQLMIVFHAIFTYAFIKTAQTVPFRAAFIPQKMINMLMVSEQMQEQPIRQAQIDKVFRTQPPRRLNEVEVDYMSRTFSRSLGKPVTPPQENPNNNAN